MINGKSLNTYTGVGTLSAFAASICCITPVIALLAGSSSIAGNFSWVEPARPYLVGLSISVLAFAWYVKLKPVKTNDVDCTCETTSGLFLQSKTFLSLITAFAILMMAFPVYSKIFYPKPKAEGSKNIVANTKQQAIFIIQGMTCEACEAHVNTELSKVAGMLAYKTSYSEGNSLVTFDSSKSDLKTVAAAIKKTGYKVMTYNVVNSSNTTATRRKSN
ncbi:MAG: mercuric transport protein MerTP [Daejeonella sp.]